MSNIDIIRAWKDAEYRNSLTDEQKTQLPDNPAGAINLTDEQMETITGGGIGGSRTSNLFQFTCNPDCQILDPSRTVYKDVNC
jgi:mersacidin/lichenicidin family type 2 lantibiotic